jgi:hypothetical protein
MIKSIGKRQVLLVQKSRLALISHQAAENTDAARPFGVSLR